MGDTIFVQQKDFIRIINHYAHECPEALANPHLIYGILSVDKMSLYAFSDKTSCEWIESQDWILDFDELNRLSIPDIEKMIEEVVDSCENSDKLFDAGYKLSMLYEFLDYKKERTYFIFPAGYQLP